MVFQKLLAAAKIVCTIFCLLTAFSASAQWQKVKENGFREFLTIAKAGNRTIAISLDGKVFNSQDAGLSWQEIIFPANLVDAFAKTEHSAGKPGILYFSFFTFDGGGVTGQFLLRSKDDGLTWQKLPLNNDYVYNVFSYSNGVLVVQANGIFRLRDDSDNLEKILAGGNDKTKFYTANNRLWRFQGGGSAYSLNDGDTWNFVGPGGFAADMAVKGDTVCIVNDPTGIYRSIDAGLTWVEVYSQPISQNFYIHADEHGFYRYYYDDNQIDRSEDGFASWGPMFQSAFKIRGLVYQNGVYIVATGRGLLRTENDGLDWDWVYNGIEPLANAGDYFLLSGDDLLCAGRTILTNNAGDSWDCDPRRVTFRTILKKGGNYFGTIDYNGLIKSNGQDIGDWSNVGPLPLDGIDLHLVQGQFVSLAQDWLFRSPDEGQSWEQLNYLAGLGPMIFFEDSLYRVTGGFYKSADFGATWELQGILPAFLNNFSSRNARAYHDSFYLLDRESIMVSKDRGKTWSQNFHPFYDPNGNTEFQGFLVNEYGIFVHWNHRIWLSPDDGLHWININENLPHQRYGSLEWVNNALFVADYDGNIWKRTDFDFVFNTMVGTVFLDENANGQFDPQERKLPNVTLATSSGQSAAISNTSGNYALFYGIVPDTLRISPATPYVIKVPPYHLIQAGDTLQNFGVQLIPDKHDLSVSLTQYFPFVTGFGNTLLIRVDNPGTVLPDGTLTLTLDSDLQYESATPSPTSVNGNTITWNFYSFTPLTQQDFRVYVNIPASVLSNTPIEITAVIKETNNASEETPGDNTAGIISKVVSSFDPNDKQVLPAIYTLDSLAKAVPLDYTIRFQNTGNYPASFVYILDTLSPALDFSTFKLIASSHRVSVSIRSGNILEFFFSNINLADTITNEPGSHGFVRYSMVPKQSVIEGSHINNKAFIYFDYNSPVATNTVETVIGDVTTYVPTTNNPSLLIYPNPTSTGVRLIKSDQDTGVLKIFNHAGQLMLQKPTSGSTIDLDLEHLAPGFYLVNWMRHGGGVYSGKFIKVK